MKNWFVAKTFAIFARASTHAAYAVPTLPVAALIAPAQNAVVEGRTVAAVQIAAQGPVTAAAAQNAVPWIVVDARQLNYQSSERSIEWMLAAWHAVIGRVF